MRDALLQDRATTNLTRSIPIGPVGVYDEYVLHRGASGTWVYVPERASLRLVEVPVDFYLLEARSVEAEEPESVLAFLHEWGLPVDPLNRDINADSKGLEDLALAMDHLTSGVTLGEGREAAAIELGLVQPATWWTAGVRGTAEGFRMGQLREQTIASVTNWAEVTCRIELMWDFSQMVVDKVPAQLELAETVHDLNAALAVFAPAVTVPGYTSRMPTIFNVVAAQIVNDLHDGATILKCHNETCRQPFTKQRGRSEQGAYRTKGVMYHTKECAKAQAQRELRRRRRKEQTDA